MHDMTDIVTSGEIFVLTKGKIFLYFLFLNISTYLVTLILRLTAQDIIGCVL